jgi:hypothetical protein
MEIRRQNRGFLVYNDRAFDSCFPLRDRFEKGGCVSPSAPPFFVDPIRRKGLAEFS